VAIEAELVTVAQPLLAYALLRTIPGVGPTVAALLLAEIGDIAWHTKSSQLRKLAGLDIIWVATGQWTGTARISKCGRPLLRWALYQAALGAARTPLWRTRRAAMIAKRHGDRFAFLKANIELAAKLLRLVWGVWRSGRAYELGRVEGRPRRRGKARAAHPAEVGRGGSRAGEPCSAARGQAGGRGAGPPSGRSQRKGVLTHKGSRANGFGSPAGRV